MFKVFFRELLEELAALWTMFKSDLVRIALLAGLGLLLLQPDTPTLNLISYCFGLSVLLVAASHVLRKILFRRIDLVRLAEDALQNMNLAAAVVFASVCFVLVALMVIMALPVMIR